MRTTADFHGYRIEHLFAPVEQVEASFLSSSVDDIQLGDIEDEQDQCAQDPPIFDKCQFLRTQIEVLDWLRFRSAYDERPIEIKFNEKYVLDGTHEGYQRMLDSLAVDARLYDNWSGLMTTPV